MIKALLLFLTLGCQGWAHEGLDEQIKELTSLIAPHPSSKASAIHYLRRGECFRQHGEWVRAKADLEKAAALNPGLDGLDLSRAKYDFESGDAAGAIPCLDRHLKKHPMDQRAVVLRARSLAAAGRPLEAAKAWQQALTTELSVDYYLEGSRAYELAGNRAAARDLTKDGLKKLGPVPALQARLKQLTEKPS